MGLELAPSHFRVNLDSAQGEGLVLSKGSGMSFTDVDIVLHLLPKQEIPLSVYGVCAIGAVTQTLELESTDDARALPESGTRAAVGFGLGIRYFPFRHLALDRQVRYDITGFSSSAPCGEYTEDGKLCYLDEG